MRANGVNRSFHKDVKRGLTSSLLSKDEFGLSGSRVLGFGVYSMSRNASARIGRRRGFMVLLKITWIPSVRRSVTLLSKVVERVWRVWCTFLAVLGLAKIVRRWEVASVVVVSGFEPVLFCTIRRM